MTRADIEGGSTGETDAGLLTDPWASGETGGDVETSEDYEFTGDMAGDSWVDNYEDVNADPENRHPDNAFEAWLASGTSRTFYDWAMDYDGKWAGKEDTRDLVGPSVYLGNLLDVSSEEPGFQYRNDAGAENDPTHPDNRPDVPDPTEPDEWLPENWRLIGGGVLVVVVLIMLAPYAELGAEVSKAT